MLDSEANFLFSLNDVRKIKESPHSFWEMTRGYKPFRDFINRLFKDNGGLDGLTLNTFERLFSLALDPGLKRDIKGGQKGVPFLNRQGFISFLKKAIGLLAPDVKEGDFSLSNRNFVIFKFDLAGIGDLEEKEGDKRINDAARILNDLYKQLRLPTGYKLYSGRYGGDEFVVGLVGLQGVDTGVFITQANRLQETLQQKFKEKNQCQENEIPIKNGQIDKITLPEDETERKIFLAYLNRGIILNEEELEKEKERVGRDIEKLKQLIDDSIATNIYSKDNPTLVDKINYYKKYHPELYFPIISALKLDNPQLTLVHLEQYLSSGKQNGDLNITSLEKVIKFIENFLADPLLDRIVISRFDLFEHIKRGEFSQLFAFEVKLKEINDYFSLADGDKLIKELWRAIKDAIGEDNLSFFSIGRAGATIFLGLKKEVNIPQDKLDQIISKFKEIKSIKLPETTIDNFVGFYQDDQIDVNNPDEEVRKMFRRVDDSWFSLVCGFINIKDNFEQFKIKVKSFLKTPDVFEIKETIDLLVVYFFGKREERRIKSVIGYLSSRQEEFKDLFNFFQSYRN
ncbi:MAG: GGDEF domain-containing protein [Candidatus Omnitrophica bacterium]|nr:GGDEF domain-containing protein [Candidatus Omnitrophota bacterium]